MPYSYIYLIVNNLDGKTYIGQKILRKKDYYEDGYMGSGKHLIRAQKKYGIQNFEKFLIQYCYSRVETDKAEKFWISEYRKRGKAEYNIGNGGIGSTGVVSKPSLGTHWYTNGIKNIQTKECPEGFWKGRTLTVEQRKFYSENMKKVRNGKEPWNKGTKGVCKAWNKGKKGYKTGHSNLKGKHWKIINGKRVWYS